MKSDRIILAITAVIMLVIGYVWWITVKDGRRLLSGDRGNGVVYSNDSTYNNQRDSKDKKK